MLAVRDAYEPKVVFSSSGLSRARRCLRSWALRYLKGHKESELSWAEASALVKPKLPPKATARQRLALKVYNSRFRKALGKECHARLERYYKGGDVDWNDKPGRIALVGLACLPHPDECEVVEAEGEIEIVVDGVHFRGYRDLLVKQHGRWLLVDHKTTYTFDFFDREKTLRTVKTPEQLRADPQANLYAYDVMRREGLAELACRWVYYRTEGKPSAMPVDFVLTWAEAKAFVDQLVVEARELAGRMQAANDNADQAVAACPQNAQACGDFGGCEFHTDRGGPCTPPAISPGARLLQLRTKAKARAALPPRQKKERRTMGFRNTPAPKPPAATTEEPATEQAEAATTEEPPAAPAPRAARAPRPAAAPTATTGELVVSYGETSFAVPGKSPLFKPLMAAVKAQEAFAAALGGES